MGLGGCSAFDVLSILEKQKQEVKKFKVTVKADREEAIPAVFKKIHVHYELSGCLVILLFAVLQPQ